MNKTYEFYSLGKGGKTIITINNGALTISRPGLMSKLSHGFSGEKTILIKNISAVQLKKVGFSRGYLQFIIAGTIEKRSGITKGDVDENIVYFDAGGNKDKINNDAEEIKKYIENYNTKDSSSSNSKYDDLEKLKKLLDNEIITKEEFDKEKEKILNS